MQIEPSDFFRFSLALTAATFLCIIFRFAAQAFSLLSRAVTLWLLFIMAFFAPSAVYSLIVSIITGLYYKHYSVPGFVSVLVDIEFYVFVFLMVFLLIEPFIYARYFDMQNGIAKKSFLIVNSLLFSTVYFFLFAVMKLLVHMILPH